MAIILVFLSVAGYGTWAKVNQSWPFERNLSGTRCDSGERCEVRTDQTADWKTYRNEEYGFEIKYPKTLIGEIHNRPDTIFAIRGEGHYMELTLSVEKSDKSLDEAYKDTWTYKLDPGAVMGVYREDVGNMPIQVTQYCIFGHKNLQDCYNSLNGDKSSVSFQKILKKDNTIFIFTFIGNYENNFVPVITTFKFVEPGTEASEPLAKTRITVPKFDFSEWRIYQNDNYGFEFRYPRFDFGPSSHGTGTNAKGTFDSVYFDNFYVTIGKNPDNLSLRDWYKKYIDDSSVRLYQIGLINDIEIMFPINGPQRYGGLGNLTSLMEPSKKFVMVFGLNDRETSDLSSNGYSGFDGQDLYIRQIISTLKFTK